MYSWDVIQHKRLLTIIGIRFTVLEGVNGKSNKTFWLTLQRKLNMPTCSLHRYQKLGSTSPHSFLLCVHCMPFFPCPFFWFLVFLVSVFCNILCYLCIMYHFFLKKTTDVQTCVNIRGIQFCQYGLWRKDDGSYASSGENPCKKLAFVNWKSRFMKFSNISNQKWM